MIKKATSKAAQCALHLPVASPKTKSPSAETEATLVTGESTTVCVVATKAPPDAGQSADVQVRTGESPVHLGPTTRSTELIARNAAESELSVRLRVERPRIRIRRACRAGGMARRRRRRACSRSPVARIPWALIVMVLLLEVKMVTRMHHLSLACYVLARSRVALNRCCLDCRRLARNLSLHHLLLDQVVERIGQRAVRSERQVKKKSTGEDGLSDIVNEP